MLTQQQELWVHHNRGKPVQCMINGLQVTGVVIGLLEGGITQIQTNRHPPVISEVALAKVTNLETLEDTRAAIESERRAGTLSAVRKILALNKKIDWIKNLMPSDDGLRHTPGEASTGVFIVTMNHEVGEDSFDGITVIRVTPGTTPDQVGEILQRNNQKIRDSLGNTDGEARSYSYLEVSPDLLSLINWEFPQYN